MAATNFKVVIVGGGPVGLTAAHALLRAGIDFVLLESRQSIVIEAGSNLVLSPMGLRILANLGLLDAFARVSTVVGTTHRRSHDGRDLGDFYVAKRIEEKYQFATFLAPCPAPCTSPISPLIPCSLSRSR